MGRLREFSSEAPGGVVGDVSPTKARADALSEAAYSNKRAAENLIEQEHGRARVLATFAGCGGILSLLFGIAAMAGLGQPQLLSVLAGVAVLVPTAYAFSHALGAPGRIADASYDRGFTQALASHSKRLGDSVGATDLRNVLLGPEAVINSQLDVLYKDLDRAKQRLRAAGADSDVRADANRLHERIVPTQVETFLAGSDGRRYPVRIIDVSQSGVSLKGAFPPLYQGEQVQVGARRAQVLKVSASQVMLSFLTPILPSEFNRKIVL